MSRLQWLYARERNVGYGSLGCIVKSRQLTISPEAKRALESAMAASGLKSPVACVLFTSGGVRSRRNEEGQLQMETIGSPGWRVAFYERSEVPFLLRIRIDGIPFRRMSPLLNGALLEWKEGKFHVEAPAP